MRDSRSLFLQELALSRRKCVKNCQSHLEGPGLPRAPGGGGSVFSFHRTWLAWASGENRGGAWSRRAPATLDAGVPRGKATPGSIMHCGPRHSERRVSALQVWPGPSQSSFLCFRGRSTPFLAVPVTLPASRHDPGPGPLVYRPTPGQELSRGGGRRMTLEPKSSGGARLRGVRPFRLVGCVGPCRRRLPLGWRALGMGQLGLGGPSGRDSRSRLPGAEGIPWLPAVRNIVIHLGCVGAPKSLT